MKTHHIKIIFAFVLILSSTLAFTQQERFEESERQRERQEPLEELEKDIKSIHEIMAESMNLTIEPMVINNLKPRWFCPFVKQDFYYRDIEICITNFSLKPVTIRFILWDDKGKVEKSFDYEVKGKAQLVFDLIFDDIKFEKFRGSMEVQSDSPAIFPSAHYFSIQGLFPGSEGEYATRVYYEKIHLEWRRLGK